MHPGWSPQLNGKDYQDWLNLFNEVEAALGEDPASEKVQALAERWKAMESRTRAEILFHTAFSRAWLTKSVIAPIRAKR